MMRWQIYMKSPTSILGEAGLSDYEISNHSKPGYECIHNLQYWEMRDYLGIGAGAHSRLTDEAECAGLSEHIGAQIDGCLRPRKAAML